MLTFLLPEHLKSLDYDADKQTVTAKIFLGDKPDGELTLTGPTKYAGINKITIEAEVDKGEAGIKILSSKLEVTAYEPPQRFDVRSALGPVSFAIRHTLTAAAACS